MKLRYLLFSVVFSLTIFCVPQIEVSANTSSCINISHNLAYGSTDARTGGDVIRLQIFLTRQGYFSAIPNGNFGPLTLSSVKIFQIKNDIAGPGNAGYGKVGPLTRAKIKSVSCLGQNNPAPLQPSPTSQPVQKSVSACTNGALFNIYTGQKCSTQPIQPAPVINPIQTPQPTPNPIPISMSTSTPTPTPAPTYIFTVNDYGAKGDGVTDDTAAINKALADLVKAGHGTLSFGSGIYRINSSIAFNNMSNFSVTGNNTTIKPLDTVSNAAGSDSIFYIQSSSNFTIQGITFDGNVQNRGIPPQSGAAQSIYLNDASNFTIQNNTFTNAVTESIFLWGLVPTDDTTATHDGVIQNNVITNSTRNGIAVIHGNNIKIIGNTISLSHGLAPEAGIDIESNDWDSENANHDITISNNTFQNNAEFGVSIIKTKHPTRITISSNTFDNNPSAIFNEGQNVTIASNTFKNARKDTPNVGGWVSYAQIFSDIATGATLNITGNTFSNINNLQGIYLFQTWKGTATISGNSFNNFTGANNTGIAVWTDGTTVSGNTLQNISGDGIDIEGASNNTVINNTLTNGTSLGIYVEGTGNKIQNNTITDVGVPNQGLCIQSLYSQGGNSISGNTIKKTVPDTTWAAIKTNATDILGTNYRYGVQGADGAFTTLP